MNAAAKTATLILAIALTMALPLLFAQEAPSNGAQPETKGSSWGALPIVFYSPETRWAGGFGAIIAFHPRWSRDLSRPSSVSFSALYTQNRQFAFNLKPELYLDDSSAQLLGNIDIKHYPDSFFGIGNDTPADAEEPFTQDMVSVEVSLLKRLWTGKRIYAGLTYGGDYYKLRRLAPAGALRGGSVLGSRGGLASGLAMVLKWDDRDNLFYSRRGRCLMFSADWHSPLLGSDYAYLKLKADVRCFLPVSRTHVLALQAVFQEGLGGVPFMSLPKLGGDGILRGYNSSRYRDKVLVAAQAEYRLPVWRRFKLTAFAGLGEVAGRPAGLSLAGLRASAGFGVRFNIMPSEGTNIRLDLGFGRGSSGTYITAGEAI